MKTVKYFFSFLLFSFIFIFSSCKEKSCKSPIVLHFFSNLPDRTFGQGLVEQMIIDDYMKENPHVKIIVEALDEAAFKTKFYVYCHERLPDIVHIWGHKPVMEQAVNSGKLLALEESDFSDLKFKKNSLDGFMSDGKLYGLPRNTDIALLFYNKKMFDAFDWKLPETFDELFELSKEIKRRGFIPLSMDGRDGWPLAMLWSDIFNDLAGKNYKKIIEDAIENHDFSHPLIRESLEIFSDICSKKLFQEDFIQDDYGAAESIFISGKAAMFYMGSWVSAIASNSNYLNEITPYIHAALLPSVKKDCPGKDSVLAWYGGGYGISSDSLHKEEASKFLKYMFNLEKLSKYGFQNSTGPSAQDESELLQYVESPCLKEILDIAENEDKFTSASINDLGNLKFKHAVEVNIIKLASGRISVDEFIRRLQKENVY